MIGAVSLIGLSAGVVLGILLVLLARRRSKTGERFIYAVGLLVAALVYLAFAVVDGAAIRWLAMEWLGVFGFGALCWLGVRRGADALLSLGWTAHALWDVLLHATGSPGAAYTPYWYPWFCLSFDLVVALALLRGYFALPLRRTRDRVS